MHASERRRANTTWRHLVNPGKCQKVFLGRGQETPCWQRGGLDGYVRRDARAAGHGCFIISKQNPIERSGRWNSAVAKDNQWKDDRWKAMLLCSTLISFYFQAISASFFSSAARCDVISCLRVNIYFYCCRLNCFGKFRVGSYHNLTLISAFLVPVTDGAPQGSVSRSTLNLISSSTM